MTDDGIRERHGVACREREATASNVLGWEEEQAVRLNDCSYTRAMTPVQARYLARKLYRLARRIERRLEVA